MTLRKRLFAWCYHHLLAGGAAPDLDDPFTRDVRLPLLQRARGDVLEVGAGEGGNLSLYPPGVRLTLLEPNPFMIRYLRERCAVPDAPCVSVVEAVGERLPFSGARFDTVVTTHVLCSVRDLPGVLGEVRRVLRPGGQFLFVEHIAAPPDSLTNRVQRVINPAWMLVGDGCHLTRNTGAAIRAAGFQQVDAEAFEVGGWPRVVSPHVVGAATA